MDKIRITKPEHLSTNERGSTYQIFTRATEGFMLAFRKAGSVSGNHWHEGNSRGKNPEILLLVNGEAEIYARDLETAEELAEKLKAPALVEIDAGVLHKLNAITDCSFLEFNSLEEHKQDTLYPDSN
jgi:hypothetical protein